MSDPALGEDVPFASGVRAAGSVFTLGYLVGFVPGPLIAAVGGVALITLGRGLLVSRRHEALMGTALAVLAGALGVVALRWGSLELPDIRGAQAVFGPSISVGPALATAGAIAAAIAAIIALTVWHTSAARGSALLVHAESAIAAALIGAVFWGPTPAGGAGVWVTAVGLWLGGAAVLVMGVRLLAPKIPPSWRWPLLGAGLALAVLGAVLVTVA